MSKVTKGLVAAIVLAGIGYGGYTLMGGTRGNDGSVPEMPAASGPLEINFTNGVWDTLTKVEVSAAGQDTFSVLDLSEGTATAGETEKLSIADGNTICTFDFRVTKEDGSTGVNKNRNLCDNAYYTYDDESPITFTNKTGADANHVVIEVISANSGSVIVSQAVSLVDYKLGDGQSVDYNVRGLGRLCTNPDEIFIRMGSNQNDAETKIAGAALCDLLDGGSFDLMAN